MTTTIELNSKNKAEVSFSEVGIFSASEKSTMQDFKNFLSDNDFLFLTSKLVEEFQDGGLPTGMYEDYLVISITPLYIEENEKLSLLFNEFSINEIDKEINGCTCTYTVNNLNSRKQKLVTSPTIFC